MKVATVIPLQKGPMAGDLTYFTSKNIAPGNIVSVTLRSKKILGLVVSAEDLEDAKGGVKEMDFKLKKILEVKENSIFSKEFFDSAMEASRYFATSPNNGLTHLMPSIFRSEYDKIAKFKNATSKTEPDGEKKMRSEKLLLQLPLKDRFFVYKTLIRESFASKKSVFVALPTESEVETFFESLSKGIEQFSFFAHGGLTPKKSLATLEKITENNHPILVVGTPPFLSIPRHDLGTIILEHESSAAYKTIRRPNMDLRVFVELFASKINARLILSDNLLRFETIGRTERDGLHPMHPLSFRLDFKGDITISAPTPKRVRVPTSYEIRNVEKKFQVLKPESLKEIEKAIHHKKNVFVFALRRGLATSTICRDCNETLSCPACRSPVVLYLSQSGTKRMFICNRCGTELPPDTLCKSCGSWNLFPLGIGTDTVVGHLEEVFPTSPSQGGPKTKIFKLDKEAAKTKKQAEKIIESFEYSEGAILVGTEMALFYLKNKVPVSMIASFDSFWSIPNFKISEKIVQLIIAIAGMTKEKFLIQTKNPDDEAILAISRNNLLNFIRKELDDRKALGYPPYKRFIKITHVGDKIQTLRAKEFLKEHLKEYGPEVFSGFLSKQKGKHIANALIKLSPERWSLPEILSNSSIDGKLFTKLISLPKSFEIFVDPEDLL